MKTYTRKEIIDDVELRTSEDKLTIHVGICESIEKKLTDKFVKVEDVIERLRHLPSGNVYLLINELSQSNPKE